MGRMPVTGFILNRENNYTVEKFFESESVTPDEIKYEIVINCYRLPECTTIIFYKIYKTRYFLKEYITDIPFFLTEIPSNPVDIVKNNTDELKEWIEKFIKNEISEFTWDSQEANKVKILLQIEAFTQKH